MGLSFVVKQTPPHLFEDHFTSFDSAVWPTEENLNTPTIVNTTWLDWNPSGTYGQLSSKDLELAGVTGANYKITARVRNIGDIVSTLTCFGLKFEGSGMHWYEQAATFEVFLQRYAAAGINWTNGNRGIRGGTSEPINIITSQKDGTFSMSVAYEEVSYQIYDWSDSVAFNPTLFSPTGVLQIGQGYGATHWEVDYITLDLPD